MEGRSLKYTWRADEGYRLEPFECATISTGDVSVLKTIMELSKSLGPI